MEVRVLTLFDIDGTLVDTGGAGRRAMARAFEATLGVTGALDGVTLAGRTDEAIIVDVLARIGATGVSGNGWRREFEARYLECLAEALPPGAGRDRTVLPGVVQLLDALEERGEATLALLTGNFRATAEVKLAHANLWHRFAFGAFGGETACRNDLLPIALDHAAERGLPALPPHRVVIVGDTVHDVACAKSGGARCLGVATGGATAEELREAGADLVVDDLSDTLMIVDWLRR